MYNILSNAVKFTPEGGKVRLTAELLDDIGRFLDTEKLQPGKYILISVIDNGIGIAPENHDAVWGKFRQVESTYTRTQEGTGLGLALTKRLVEIQGGAIWFESKEGEGTTFSFVIPIESTEKVFQT